MPRQGRPAGGLKGKRHPGVQVVFAQPGRPPQQLDDHVLRALIHVVTSGFDAAGNAEKKAGPRVVPLQNLNGASGKLALYVRLEADEFRVQPAGKRRLPDRAHAGEMTIRRIEHQTGSRIVGIQGNQVDVRILETCACGLPGDEVQGVNPVRVAADVGRVV